MFTLDPLKLVLVAAVALVVLGPDKLPALARRASSLMTDLERVRASVGDHARRAAADLDLGHELGQAEHALATLRRAQDPHAARLALLRAAGLEPVSGAPAERSGSGGEAGRGELEAHPVPGSIDLRVSAPHLVRVAPSGDHGERSGEPGTGGRASPTRVAAVHQPALFDVAGNHPADV